MRSIFYKIVAGGYWVFAAVIAFAGGKNENLSIVVLLILILSALCMIAAEIAKGQE